MAGQEIEEIIAAFKDYFDGKPGPWLVLARRLKGRLDAKYLRPWSTSQLEATWHVAGATSAELGELVEPIEARVAIEPDREYTFIRCHLLGQM